MLQPSPAALAATAATDACEHAARREAETRSAHVLASAQALLVAREVVAAAQWQGPAALAAAVDQLALALAEEERVALDHQRACLAVIEAARAEREAKRASQAEALQRHYERQAARRPSTS